jgi:hypothetical protein
MSGIRDMNMVTGVASLERSGQALRIEDLRVLAETLDDPAARQAFEFCADYLHDHGPAVHAAGVAQVALKEEHSSLSDHVRAVVARSDNVRTALERAPYIIELDDAALVLAEHVHGGMPQRIQIDGRWYTAEELKGRITVLDRDAQDNWGHSTRPGDRIELLESIFEGRNVGADELVAEIDDDQSLSVIMQNAETRLAEWAATQDPPGTPSQLRSFLMRAILVEALPLVFPGLAKACAHEYAAIGNEPVGQVYYERVNDEYHAIFYDDCVRDGDKLYLHRTPLVTTDDASHG